MYCRTLKQCRRCILKYGYQKRKIKGGSTFSVWKKKNLVYIIDIWPRMIFVMAIVKQMLSSRMTTLYCLSSQKCPHCQVYFFNKSENRAVVDAILQRQGYDIVKKTITQVLVNNVNICCKFHKTNSLKIFICKMFLCI